MNTIFGPFQPNTQNPGTPSPFANFVTNFMQKFPNLSPQQIGMNLLNSGKLSQADFQAFSQIANKLTGRH